MTHVTEDDLDDLEFDTLRTGDHTSAARRLSELAASVSGGVSRANVLLRAGEQWQHAGDHAKAADLYRQAIEDGGETYGDPRAYLADALFELGETGEARSLLDQIRADRPRDPEVYRTVAEILYAHGDMTGAYDWATSGADMVLSLREQDPGNEENLIAEDSLEALLRLRYRARIDLGRPEDEYDAMLDDLLKTS
ncbi:MULTISPECIES: tetratricopeptide repeat protein [Thermomonospora]|uniref:Tetratricopeptide (TPR) repeat protein n=1 Tax=Thermomonospora cellulosilytica TaxID=1411118 RepID=A0A7W3R7J9_9ACTN|nr:MULTISPECIES: tetratricopeptide repeat protein [Thermomonospora]MBA9002430.1 tetratricopeptide (TPR) repeat protein [Thermomonospora cellulosilytica]